MTPLVNIRRPTVDWVVNLQHIVVYECVSVGVYVVLMGKRVYTNSRMHTG